MSGQNNAIAGKKSGRGACIWAAVIIRGAGYPFPVSNNNGGRIVSGTRGGVSGKRGHNNYKSGGGGIQPKRQGQGSLPKNLGTKSAKPFWYSRKFWF